MVIFQSLQFWTLLAGVLAFTVRFFYPALPLDSAAILALVLFFLGLFGITPKAGLMRASGLDLLKSLPFWTLLAGLGWFVAHFFFPAFPLDEAGVLALIVFLLGLFGIKPELRNRGLLAK